MWFFARRGRGCERRASPRAARFVRARYRTPHTHSALAAKSSGVAMHTKCKTSEVLNVSNVQRRMERIALTAPTVQLSVKKSAKCVSRLERGMNLHYLSALESRSRAPRAVGTDALALRMRRLATALARARSVVVATHIHCLQSKSFVSSSILPFRGRKTRTSRRGLPREESHHFPSWRPFRRRRPPLTGSHRLSGRRR